ncbi:unnamed protein product, partial [Musa acuminata subsp. burmannicoides]
MCRNMVNAVAVLGGTEGVGGVIYFSQEGNGPTMVNGNISGLSPGLHGFHVHEFGDTTNGCMSTGPHFNPTREDHGDREDPVRHIGDLGNVIAGDDGTANFTMFDSKVVTVQSHSGGSDSIVGRAIVVHADPDDLGRVFFSFVLFGGHELSKTTGNSGARVACG